MLAIAEQELLAPAERFGDVHMDVLPGLQIDQDHRPQRGMERGKAADQPRRPVPGSLALAASHAASRRIETLRFRRAAAGKIDAVDMDVCVARFLPQWNQLGVKKAP